MTEEGGGGGSLPRFGDEETADVILFLIPSIAGINDNGEEEEKEEEEEQEKEEHVIREPICLRLHSRALRRSEYFEARLSERWTSTKLRGMSELTLDGCKDLDTYKRCLELMYVPAERVRRRARFAGVSDALALLGIAAELLFPDGVRACLRYLEGVPWAPDHEIAIRARLAEWELTPTADLAARLCAPASVPDCRPIDAMQGVLGELLALVTGGAPPRARDVAERVLLANAHPSAPPCFAAANEAALARELRANLDALKAQLRKFANFFSWNSHQLNVASSALRWILEELFTLHAADAAVEMLAEEHDLADLMLTRVYQNPFTDPLFHILARMLAAVRNGEVIAPRPVRLALVSTWLPVIAKLGNDGEDPVKVSSGSGSNRENPATALQQDLEEGLCSVVSTLPMADQEAVFKIWIGTCLKCRRAWPDLSTAFDSWCSKLRQAQQEKEKDREMTEGFTGKDSYSALPPLPPPPKRASQLP